ncbi:hypothetical protein C7377_1597 [Balneicella halophila]|uniref:DUF1508 domain-containing protein n=1 Tax=Balneicella halophila TaxID=1537566 RepID=A0A7L4UNT6_BALHA|nr:YegP family protein [Balneicella halophila]PVX49957.1 hypothetical protein C7377_1597 [Balneicella halophila]
MFEVYKSEKNQEFYFRLKAKNGEAILTSQGYKSKASCLNGVESVKRNSQNVDLFEIKEAKDGRMFFNLKATNGQIIGSSQMYKSESGMKNGIASVQKNASGEVKDLTEA